MKKIISRFLVRVLPVMMLGMGTFSCENTFDLQPKINLDKEQRYQNVFDADAAVMGVYGKFLTLAEQYVVLNELRADLLNVTENAATNTDLLQVNYHSVDAASENKYADPRPFYEVIMAINDVIENFQVMVEEEKMTQEEFNSRYSDMVALRSWLYLQLGIHFNEIPYITDPIAEVDDIETVLSESNLTWLRLDDGSLLSKLIQETKTLPYLNIYEAGSSLIPTNDDGNLIPIDNFTPTKFFINKHLLLGDLYLWNNDYTNAAIHYKEVMETVKTGNNVRDKYKLNNDGFDPATLFTGVQNEFWDNNWIWDMPFSPNFNPENPFIDLFSPIGGAYLLKPSEKAIENWELEIRTDNSPFDPRMDGAVEIISGEPVAYKYLQAFNPALPYEKPGNWFLARTALLHLRFAEAANRDGYHKVAYALLNRGIQITYNPDNLSTSWDDVTDVMQTKAPYPYNMDARFGSHPYYRAPYSGNSGIRGRAGVIALDYTDITSAPDSLIALENDLIHEAGLELAFEGHRWPDLLRIAMRRNEPAFLANAIYEKFAEANDPRATEIRTRLMNPGNWFLPFRWE